MEKPAGSAHLHEFFLTVARESFTALGVDDPAVVDYVAALLTEFARHDRLYPLRDARGRAIDRVTEIARVAPRAAEDPKSLMRTRALQKYVGDYTLFMSGLFRAHVESRGVLTYYVEEGQRSYWAVSELDLSRFRTGFLFFQQLSKNFEHYAGALDYMRKTYFSPQAGGSPFAEFLRQVQGWIDGGLSRNDPRAARTVVRVRVTGPATRLDRVLLADPVAAGLGRRRLARLLAAGDVRVNGRPAAKGTTVQLGDEITIAHGSSPALPAADVPVLAVLHEDAHVVAIDKPPGVPSTIGASATPSIATALLRRFPEMAAIDATRAAGLAHRLDTGTSGLLIAARDSATHARLRAAFTRKAVEKTYWAVVHGRVAQAHVVEVPLARRPHSARRMIAATDDAKGWPARTEVTPRLSDGELTLVRLRMRTGVTHQLRVHLALLGHPVVGDHRYGPGNDVRADSLLDASWHYLHAHALRCDAPELPSALTTPFPEHWRLLFTAREWPAELPAD